jgi:tetratricopeptide (TPR) repeat protein
LAEAVCQQCHLRGAATVLGRGRKITDYRPGLPLEDFRQDYWLEVDNAPMTVVGHVEQMHLSRCYKESQTLTCMTCHNPHAFPRPAERVAYYQAKCLRCHDKQACKVEEARRQRESPSNDCVHCHMPSSDTDVPHVSFTHHRIGLHNRRRDQEADEQRSLRIGTLRLFLENPRLGELDRKRSLGLAYLELIKEEKQPERAAEYRRRGFDLLSEAHRAGLPDSVVEANLARIHFEREEDQALGLAASALADRDLSGLERCTALFVLAAERLRNKRPLEAQAAFHELVTLRRHPHDWLLLADCEQRLGNKAAAAEALRQAARINPRLVSRP